MKIYMISYDLSNNNLYTNLYEAINKYDNKPILESVWIIATNESIDKVLNNLKSKDFTKNDKLIVMKLLLSKNAIEANNFSAEITNWLTKHMKTNIKERLSKIKNLC